MAAPKTIMQIRAEIRAEIARIKKDSRYSPPAPVATIFENAPLAMIQPTRRGHDKTGTTRGDPAGDPGGLRGGKMNASKAGFILSAPSIYILQGGDPQDIHRAAVELGTIGGKAKTADKIIAAWNNGRKGGCPKKESKNGR